MSETPEREPSHAAEESTETVPATSPAPVSQAVPAQAFTAGPSRVSKWVAVAALVLAIVAVTGTALGYFFPNKTASAPTYTDQQQNDAKKLVCKNFRLVGRAIARSPHIKPPEPGPPGVFAIVTIQQLAYVGGGALLLDRLNQNPATPSDLAKSVRDLGTELQEFSIGVFAGKKEFVQQDLRKDLDEKLKSVDAACPKQEDF